MNIKSFITRRSFMGGVAASLFLTGTGGTNLGPLRAEERTTRSKYFDIHVHLTHQWYGKESGPLTADMMVRWMDAHAIKQAAVLPLVSPEAFWYPVSSEFVISESRQHADRLIPFCCIDPRTLGTHLTTKKQVVDMLKRYQDAGVKGFGEHKPKLAVDHELNMRLYEACAEVGFPVIFHLDNGANMDKPGLPGVENALKAFPELKFIGHGKGWWASIAGELTQADLHVGYPPGKVKPGGAVDRLMEKYPNMYGDLSSSGAHALFRDPEFGLEFLKRRSKQLLFGTDYYDLNQKSFLQFDLFNKFKVPKSIREQISFGNAQRILGLS